MNSIQGTPAYVPVSCVEQARYTASQLSKIKDIAQDTLESMSTDIFDPQNSIKSKELDVLSFVFNPNESLSQKEIDVLDKIVNPNGTNKIFTPKNSLNAKAHSAMSQVFNPQNSISAKTIDLIS